jgi:hypothetical protein
MSSISQCSDRVSCQVCMEKVAVVTKPLSSLKCYKNIKNFVRSCLYRPDIESSVNKAVQLYSLSLASEEKGQSNLSVTLSVQAVQTLMHARFKPGYHPELDKIFHRCFALAVPRACQQVRDKIEMQLDKLDAKESVYKSLLALGVEAPALTGAYQEWQALFPAAFEYSRSLLAEMKIPLKHLPAELAFTIAKLFISHGLMVCQTLNSDQKADQEAISRETALQSLKTAYLLVQYRLGLAAAGPDLTILKQAHDPREYQNKMADLEMRAHAALKQLSITEWADKLTQLPQEEMLNVIAMLSSLSHLLADRHPQDADLVDKLLCTIEITLAKAIQSASYDSKEMKDQMAEFKFHELWTESLGYLAKRIAEYQKMGESEKVEDARLDLLKHWEECINLSRDPDMMWARCVGKHISLFEFSPEEKLKLLQQSLDVQLFMPEEKKNLIMIAQTWKELAHAQKQMGQETEARVSAEELLKIAEQSLQAGRQNVQLDELAVWAKRFRAE